MAEPSTKPLDGEFWYVLDEQNLVTWKPRPKLRGDFYLGWLGQDKNLGGAGLVRIKQGHLTEICTHGTPYYWLQPYESLPYTAEALQVQQALGTDTMKLDFSLAGWGMRDTTPPETQRWPDAPISADALVALSEPAVATIIGSYRSESERAPETKAGGLLARRNVVSNVDPMEDLMERLRTELGEQNMVPVLIDLVKHDINILPTYRQSDFFEKLPVDEGLPSPRKIAQLVISAIYHMAPMLGSRRLSGVLLLNSLRQRHPFDVTWGADDLVDCFGIAGLTRLLLAALVKEENDQIRGNVLDLLQELGYGFKAGLEEQVLKTLTELQVTQGLGGFGQVVLSHAAFIREYVHQRDSAADPAG